MSGVALTSRAALKRRPFKPKDPLADYLPGPLTTMREFTGDDTIALFAEFYENNLARRPTCSNSRPSCAPKADESCATSPIMRSSTELQGNTGGYGFAHAAR